MPSIQKHGRRWTYRFVDTHGKLKRRTFEQHAEAKTAMAADLARVASERRGDRPAEPAPMTFAELAREYLDHVEGDQDRRSKKDPRSLIRRHVEPYLRGMQIRDIGIGTIDTFKRAKLNAALHPQTVTHILTALSATLAFAVDRGYLRERPIIRRPKLPERRIRYVRENQVPRLLEAARKIGEQVGSRRRRAEWCGECFRLLVSLAVHTGLRKGELACLRWTDMDLERGIITVRSSFNGPPKNGRTRRVPLTMLPGLAAELRARRKQVDSEWIFPNLSGGRLSSSSRVFAEYFSRMRDAAGLDSSLRWHDLRHSFATMYTEKDGASLWRLRQYLGHQSIETTQIYAHDDEEAAEKDRGLFAPDAPARALRAVR